MEFWMGDSSSGRSSSSSSSDGEELPKLVRLSIRVVRGCLVGAGDWIRIKDECDRLEDAPGHLGPLLIPAIDAMIADSERKKAMSAQQFKAFTQVKILMRGARDPLACEGCTAPLDSMYYRCETCRVVCCPACELHVCQHNVKAKIRI